MAQTQLGRTYVQALDAAGGGASTNSLSLGTKSLTTAVIIGGIGTENKSITINTVGTTIAGPAFLSTLTATGNSILANVSVASLGVTGNVSMANVSVNTLNVVGPTGLNTLEVSALSKLQNVSVLGVLDVVGQIKMTNVSTTSLTATSLTSASLFATNLSVTGLTLLNNVSVKDLLYAAQMETPFMNVSTKATILNASINGTLNVDGQSTLQSMDVNGATMFNNTVTLSGDKSLTVGGITTLANASVNGTLAVVGNCSLTNVSAKNLTVAGSSKIGNWFMYGSDAYSLGTMSDANKSALYQNGKETSLIADNTDANGVINFKLGSTTRMTLDKNGQLGIGVTTPTAYLDVLGTVKLEGETNINAVGTADTTIGKSTGGTTYLKSQTTTVGGKLVVTGNTSVQDLSAGSTKVSSFAAPSINIGNDTENSITIQRNGTFKIGVNAANPCALILGSGSDAFDGKKVGIGMTNPTNTLDISGTLGVTGLSTLSGGLTSTAGDTTLGKTGTGALTAASLNVTGDLLTNTIKSTTNSTTFTLCGNQTDGQIDIGGGEGRTGNINIGYNVGGGSIHIGADAIGTHNIVVGTNASSSTYIRGKDINVGDNQTSGKINIGTGTSRTGDVTIGHTGSNIIMNATNIKQTVKIQSGQSIYNVLGNTVNYPSLSTTFNFKAVIPVGPVRCYRLTRESNTFNITKYFELVVCGSNTYYGPYTAKFNFIFTTYPVISITQQITILSSYGVFLTSTKIDDNTLDLFIETSATDGNGPYGGGQQFITTLTGYPTCDGGGVFRDCIITAV